MGPGYNGGLFGGPATLDRPELPQGLFDQPPAAPEERRNWWNRMMDGARNRLAPVTGAEAEGLSPADKRTIQRRALMSGGNVQEAMQKELLTMSARQQNTKQQAQAEQMQQKRSQILSQYAPQPGESPTQSAARLQQLFGELVRVGDTELAGKVGEVLKSQTSLLEPPKPVEAKPPVIGSPEWLDYYRKRKEIDQEFTPETPAGESSQLVTVTNPKTGLPEYGLLDKRTGATRLTGQQPAASRDGTATEGERKAGVLMTMAEEPSALLDEADAPSRFEQFAGDRGIREFLSANRQRIDQAGMLVADAYVRLTSGANAPEPEVKRAFGAITPQPGDSRELLAQKRKTRATFMRALRLAAGRAGSQVDARKPAGPPANAAKGKSLMDYIK